MDNRSSPDALSALLEDLFLADLDLEARAFSGGLGLAFPQPPEAVGLSIPSAYTAFNGDHFALVPLMRKYAILQGRLPMNPESIVGYRDSVLAYGGKAGVMRADLAALARCDEMWIFSTTVPTADSVGSLAEGVAIELLFYLENKDQLGDQPAVYWVDASQLLSSGTAPSLMRLDLPAGRVRHHLLVDNPEVVSFVDRALAGTQALPRIAFCLHDPLDSKYVDWVSAGAHLRGFVPVVPSKTIELGDAPTAKVLYMWSMLLRYADEMWIFPSIEQRSVSQFQEFLREFGVKSLNLTEIHMKWADFDAPKVKYGERWPLTAKERAPSRACL